MADKNPKDRPPEPALAEVMTTLTSLAAVAAGSRFRPARGHSYVSRQSSNARGREGTAESPRRIQARARRKIRNSVLHHQPRWKKWLAVSLRGMATDRRETGAPVDFQPDQEEVPESDELLRSGGGNGRAGAPADSVAVTRRG